ncbi:MAG TPA: ABC transporter ATP-binding protein [Thermodesulfobacteriota bacterium]|nr:ABC transporter ATP-binding protein [Thermodesulfobacteriota bacterium]
MLEVKNLTVAYGRIEALHGITLTIPDGKMISVIGSNGAGKTTLLNTVSGLLRPRAGSVFLDGKILPSAAHLTVAAGIVQVPEGRKVFASLTVDENLTMGAYRSGHRETAQTRRQVYEMFPILKERSAQAAGTLSGGEQQMLSIGRGLMSSPRIMLLDEPSLGLAPKIVKQIFDLIREINRRGTTLVLVEQNARTALAVAHYGYVLENGRVILEGTCSDLSKNPQIETAYLGYSKTADAANRNPS